MFNCPNCDYVSESKYNFNRHSKNCKPKESKMSTESLSTTSMFAQFMTKMQELENENKKLKDELTRKNEETNEMKPITTDLPYDYEQLKKIVYKYNPYCRQYSIRRGGFISKDFKEWYILKYFNILDYPDSKIQFYKKCLEEILKNIPNEKLPYRVRDFKRHIYDIYDYSERRWIKGNIDDLIQMTIKKIIGLIQASLYSAINIFNEINTLDFQALENRRIDPTSFNRLRMELQRDLTYTFSLPDYDDEISDEDKYNFYKKNFVKVMNERLAGDIEVEVNEDEFKEFEEVKQDTKQEIKNKKPKQKTTLKKITLSFNDEQEDEFYVPNITIDSDDEGYETDTKENPYFDF